MIIYKTINLINDKWYIGMDSNNDPNYLGSGLLLSRAIRKYGKENFKKELLEETNDLANREIYWIKETNAVNDPMSYNIAAGGKGGNTRAGYSKEELKESNQRMSEAHKGEKNHFYGKTHSEEFKRRKSKSMKGKIPSNKGKPMLEEQKRKISEKKKGKSWTSARYEAQKRRQHESQT